MSVKDSAIHRVGRLGWSLVRTVIYAMDYCGLRHARVEGQKRGTRYVATKS